MPTLASASFRVASKALNRLYFPAICGARIYVGRSKHFIGIMKKKERSLIKYDKEMRRNENLKKDSLAKRIMVTPHQMLQPHPTKQKRTVNIWDTPTIRLIMKAPSRDLIPATGENLGCPKHRLNRPLQIVPKKIKSTRLKIGYIPYIFRYVFENNKYSQNLQINF